MEGRLVCMAIHEDKRSGAFDLSKFLVPPLSAQVVYAWTWNSTISKALIDRELDEMCAAGICGVYIIALPEDFRPRKMYTPLRPGYLTDDYLEMTRYAAQAALKRKMAFWLYDEGGWPSGSAGHRVTALAPDLTRMQLRSQCTVLPGNTPYRIAEGVLAAFHSEKRVKQGDIFPEDIELTEYSACALAGSGLAESMDKRATDVFIRETHEKYAASLGDLLGEQVHFMFTDEPGLGTLPWCADFSERFLGKYGYAIEDELPAIVEPEKHADERGERIRIDYYLLCGELFRAHYLIPIQKWCHEHGMAVTGHISGEDTTTAGWRNGFGSVLATLRRMDMPGVDLIWRQLLAPDMKAQEGASEIPFFPRIGSSAARQIGARLSVSESFNIFGSGLTWEQARYLANYQYVRGINVLNGMSVPSGRDKTMALTMRPCYTPEVPGMNHMRKLNETLARTQYLLQLGKPVGTSALYVPDRDFLAMGHTADMAAKSFREMGLLLEKQGIDFDYIDDEAIRAAEMKEGALSIGNALYRKVFIPECRYMPRDVREKIEKLHDYTPQPVLVSDHDCIQARKYELEDGSRLYFVVNEGATAIQASLTFDETQPCCRLNLEQGTWKNVSEAKDTVNLANGQACVYLFTDECIPVASDYEPVHSWLLTDFQAAPRSTYRIDDMGIRKETLNNAFQPVQLGSWKKDLGLTDRFSGEVMYRTQITIPDTFQDGDQFCLDLGLVCYSAKVFVNGREVGIAPFTPYQVHFKAAPSMCKMQIDIEIANTPANEILHSDAVQRWPKDMMQWFYHDRSIQYEAESQDGGLYGPVRLTLERGN